MAAPGYVVNFDGVALVAATPKTVILAIAGANDPVTLCGFEVSVDASTTVLVELVESTQATTGTGTSVTAKQVRGFCAGDTTAPTASANKAYSAEPTVLTRLKAWRFAGPGPLVIQFPLGREPQSLVSGSTKYKAIGLRLTAAANCNCDGDLEFEE